MKLSYIKSLRIARGSEAQFHPLINSKWSYRPQNPLSRAQVKPTIVSQKEDIVAEKDQVTKKIKELDALNLFEDKDKISELIRPVSQPMSSISDLNLLTSNQLENFYKIFSSRVKEEKVFLPANPLEILFVTDHLFNSEETVDFPENVPALFSLYFSPAVALLFYKMTKAMKLAAGSFSITSIYLAEEETESNKDRVFSEIIHTKPKLIMTLGAQAYQYLNGNEVRLKDVHGQLRDIAVKASDIEFSTKLMPIFSPNLLQTAPNMKKTAWSDMQKAMEYLI
jgi:hypothetical protein